MADTILESIAVNFFANVGPLVDALTRAQKTTYEYGVSVQRANQLEEQATSTKTKYERSLGDLNEMYHRGLISLRAYNAELERMQGGALSDRMAQGMHAFAGASTRAIGATRDAASLLRGEFTTVGEAAGKIGGMATMIPGPWGQAIGSVITVVGQLVDLINHDLIQAQQAAKKEFMAIAEGAKTVTIAMRSIETGVMKEGIDMLVRGLQVQQQVERLGQVGGPIGDMIGAAGEGVAQQLGGRDRVRDWMQNQLQARLEAMNLLLTNPQLIDMRRRLAEQEIGTELLSRPIQLEEHAARRRMMMAMHRPVTGGPEQQALAERQLAQANERVAVMQLLRRTQNAAGEETMTYGAAELALREQIRVSNAALIEDMRRRKAERLEEQFERQAEQHKEQMFKLEDQFRVLGATQSGMSKDFTNRLTEQLAVERELFKLRESGGTAFQQFARRGQLEAAMEQKLLNQAFSEGNKMLEALKAPSDRYADAVEHLTHLFQVGAVDEELFAAKLLELQKAYDAATPVVQMYNASVQRGVGIVEGYRDPMDKLDDKLYDLANALREGEILWDDYERAVTRVRGEQDKLNMSLSKTQAVAYGSAEAVGRLRDYMERVSVRPGLGNSWENVGAPDRARGSSPFGALLGAMGGGGIAGATGQNPAQLPWQAIGGEIANAVAQGGAGRRTAQSPDGQLVRTGIDIGNDILRQILNAMNANNPDAAEFLPQPAEI